MFDEVEARREADNGDFQFITQRYDDKNTDDHVERFVRDVSREINASGVEIKEKPTSYNPYYLCIYGVGLGYHFMPLLEHYDPHMLVLVEADIEMLYHSTFTFDWQTLYEWMNERKKKIRLIVASDSVALLQKVNGIVQTEAIIGLDGLVAHRHSTNSALTIAFNEFQSPKTANLASFIGYIVDEYNMMKNSFRNLRAGTKRLMGPVRNKGACPLLIVGSGPSLEQNLDFIKQVRDNVVLFSSGSALAVLLRNGIIPDFQAVLERAKGNYERHVELAQDYGEELKQIVGVLTTTVWPGIDAFFKDTVYFLRPALSPLAIFCNDYAEVLNGEGPQVTNTAFVFSVRLGFKEIYLLGVDLGAADPRKPRAEQAWLTPGLKQRKLTIPVRGNLGRTVFTDNNLIQQRTTIENQIRKYSDISVYNLSGGVRIEGAKPRRVSDVSFPPITLDRTNHVRELVEQFPVLERDRFIAAWKSGQARESVAQMLDRLILILEKEESWKHSLVRKIEEINFFADKPLRQQYAPRLLRGSLLRMGMYINSLLLRVEPAERRDEMYVKIRDIFVDHLREIEMEAYALADELESEDPHFAVNFE